MVPVRTRRLVVLRDLVSNVLSDLLESFLQFLDIGLSGFKFFLRDEPRHWIQIVSNDLGTEPRRLDERRAAAHKRVQYLLVFHANVLRVQIPEALRIAHINAIDERCDVRLCLIAPISKRLVILSRLEDLDLLRIVEKRVE